MLTMRGHKIVLMGFIKILKADLNAQSKNGKKIFYEKIESGHFFAIF